MDLTVLTLEQKIGQMLLAGFDGTSPSEEITRLIREHALGGVIYFSRNVQSVAQVEALSRELQEVAADAGVLPLWVSIDQEGGMVARLTEGVALMPGNMAIGAAGSKEWAYQAAHISGKELRALGINLNFAPDLDVNNNAANPVIGVRSFGESAELVAAYGAEAIRGYQDANVVATAKHFPGHGDTDVDSHLDLPKVDHDRERLDALELVPFRRAVEEGVDAVMTAHIVLTKLEPNLLPATLSKPILTGLLRGELGFEGVVMTDCMEMNAIAEFYGTAEAAVMAVEAGADLILVSHRFDRQLGIIEALKDAVRIGRISEARIDVSVRRLLALKEKRGVLAADCSALGLEQVGCPEHRELARTISEASVTLVKDEQKNIPLRPTHTLVVSIETGVVTQVDESFSASDALSIRTLGEALKQQGLPITEYVLPMRQAGKHAEQVIQAAEAVEQIVVATYNAAFDPSQVELVEALQQLGKPLIVVALRSPYDLLSFPNVPTYLTVYESRPQALLSTSRVLTGIIAAHGSLPITISEQFPAGWGASAL